MGIISIDAQFTVDSRGSCIANTVNGCANWDIDTDWGFVNLGKAIHMRSTIYTPLNPTISYTQFTNNQFGIFIQGSRFDKIYRNHFNVGSLTGIYSFGASWFSLEENTFTLPEDDVTRGIYTLNTGNAPSRIYKNTVGGDIGSGIGYAFPVSFNNRQLVAECNTVTDPMDHFLVFDNGSIFERQGDCNDDRPAGNMFHASCGSTTNMHFFIGNNVPPFEYCDNDQVSALNTQCVTSNFIPGYRTTSSNNACGTKVAEIIDEEDSEGFYGKRSEQEELSGLIHDQYMLLDGGRTQQTLGLVHNENYSANQLYDTLLSYTPFLSDDMLVALLFRNEFNVNKLSHLLIENAPHSNLIWEAIAEADPPMHNDSLDKLKQHQDSSSARKSIIDSLNYFQLQKGLNYIDMLYYASIDTNYSVKEIKDSLANEKQAEMRMLLGDLYISNAEYTEAAELFDSLKIYFRKDKELVELRNIQLDLFADTLTYFDLDSSAIEALEEIAFNDTSVAAIEAKVILELINDTLYPYPYEYKDSSGYKRSEDVKQQVEASKEISVWSYKLIPTIIEGEMKALMELPPRESGMLYIYTIEGKPISSLNLTEGINTVPIDAMRLSKGIYIYKVRINQEVRRTDRFIKLN